MSRRFIEFWRIIVGLLRELSDESAYARHLASHDLAHSGAEWRRFSEARMKRKYSNAKCC
jgi:hypothetical protein